MLSQRLIAPRSGATSTILSKYRRGKMCGKISSFTISSSVGGRGRAGGACLTDDRVVAAAFCPKPLRAVRATLTRSKGVPTFAAFEIPAEPSRYSIRGDALNLLVEG